MGKRGQGRSLKSIKADIVATSVCSVNTQYAVHVDKGMEKELKAHEQFRKMIQVGVRAVGLARNV